MSDDARTVCTPFGPGVSLYPDSKIDAGSERSLMIAVWARAMQDVEWLDEIEKRPRSEWKKHEAVTYRQLTSGIVDPRTFLDEQRQLRVS